MEYIISNDKMLRLRIHNVLYRGSPLSKSLILIYPHIWDQICDKLYIKFSFTSAVHNHGPRISQQKAVSISLAFHHFLPLYCL